MGWLGRGLYVKLRRYDVGCRALASLLVGVDPVRRQSDGGRMLEKTLVGVEDLCKAAAISPRYDAVIPLDTSGQAGTREVRSRRLRLSRPSNGRRGRSAKSVGCWSSRAPGVSALGWCVGSYIQTPRFCQRDTIRSVDSVRHPHHHAGHVILLRSPAHTPHTPL